MDKGKPHLKWSQKAFKSAGACTTHTPLYHLWQLILHTPAGKILPYRSQQEEAGFSPCLATTQPMKKLLQLRQWEAAIHKVLLFSSKLSFKTVQFPPFLCKRMLSLFVSQTCLWQTRVCLKLWLLCCVRVCVCVKSLRFVSDSLKHYGL